ncbi:glycosyltransferase family 4 protein [Clostridium formicaceticum]|uniref:Glycosyltransferase subfamily 4-like N-terminal domain-containing protein n=1 Tax=Clostridium formicaceticum TaxID=1497 RepID=A0AAC9RJ74_9CLOT|nr:glycosyltransferase family 4 protein [Clostridium formicaceticum]AOY77502.1 hypothetical protein BJL90_17560 [Clostridium formicaceticum]ARE88069.1 hypothetical protein CLFO_24700 [Clostridium formicaceticum]
MEILFLSIIAKCGVFTHVRELALCMQKHGVQVTVGFIHNSKTIRMFKSTKEDLQNMEESLNGINHFFYESDEHLLQQISCKHIDLIHAHSPLVFPTTVQVSKKLNIPFIVTLHSVLDWNKLYPNTIAQAEYIIAVGPEAGKSVGKDFQEKLYTIFNGIDVDYYKPCSNKTVGGPLRIIWMGRTSGAAASGVSYLTKAIHILQQRGIPIEAKIIGYAVGADTSRLNVCGWVHDPLPYLQWSHIVFGRGRALREAMACGNVGFLIAQGYGGMVQESWFEKGRQPQLSGSLKHGYSELSISTIANDILYFHKHRNQLTRARSLARKIAEENFDIKKMVEQTYSVYQKALQHYIGKRK